MRSGLGALRARQTASRSILRVSRAGFAALRLSREDMGGGPQSVKWGARSRASLSQRTTVPASTPPVGFAGCCDRCVPGHVGKCGRGGSIRFVIRNAASASAPSLVKRQDPGARPAGRLFGLLAAVKRYRGVYAVFYWNRRAWRIRVSGGSPAARTFSIDGFLARIPHWVLHPVGDYW